MPIQSLMLCESIDEIETGEVSRQTLNQSDQFLKVTTHGAFAYHFVSPQPVRVQAILNIAPHPFENERFDIHLFRLDVSQQEWEVVPSHQPVCLKTSPCPVPYFRCLEIELPLAVSGMYALRAASFLESLESFEEPESEVEYKFPVYDT